jgi:hypothetical protein
MSPQPLQVSSLEILHLASTSTVQRLRTTNPLTTSSSNLIFAVPFPRSPNFPAARKLPGIRNSVLIGWSQIIVLHHRHRLSHNFLRQQRIQTILPILIKSHMPTCAQFTIHATASIRRFGAKPISPHSPASSPGVNSSIGSSGGELLKPTNQNAA